MTRRGEIIYYAALWVIAVALILGTITHPPRAKGETNPAYCYSTGKWITFPENIGSYCPDGQAPFNGLGPSYGGGNHRWPDGSDD